MSQVCFIRLVIGFLKEGDDSEYSWGTPVSMCHPGSIAMSTVLGIPEGYASSFIAVSNLGLGGSVTHLFSHHRVCSPSPSASVLLKELEFGDLLTFI